MKIFFASLLMLASAAASADTLRCEVTKVGLRDSSQESACGSFEFALPHDLNPRHGTGACAGLELETRWFGEGNVQFVLHPSPRELGPNGNSGYAWVAFHHGFPADFSLQAIGGRSNYVVRCTVKAAP